MVIGLGAFLREWRVRRADIVGRAACLIVPGILERDAGGRWNVIARSIGTQAFYNVEALAVKNACVVDNEGRELPQSGIDWVSRVDRSSREARLPAALLPGSGLTLKTGFAVESSYEVVRAQISVQYTDVEGRSWVRTGSDLPRRRSLLQSRLIRFQARSQLRKFAEFARAQQMQKADLAIRQTDASKVRAEYWFELDASTQKFVPRVRVVNDSSYTITQVRVRTFQDFRIDPHTSPSGAEVWFESGLFDWVRYDGSQAREVDHRYARPKDRAVDVYSRDDARAWDIAEVPSGEVREFSPNSWTPCY